MIRHHPSEATLLAYAAGRLPEPHRIVLRTHLALCPACAQTVGLAIEIGGALLDESAPVALGEGALARTLDRLDLRDPAVPAAPVPVTVAALATGRWRWIGPGLRMMPLRPRDADDARLDLIRVAPGMELPTHGHTGTELTCVLQGAFRDETGVYTVGDVAEGDESLEHQPSAMPTGEVCVCLIATTGRLRAQSWLARLIQPLIGV